MKKKIYEKRLRPAEAQIKQNISPLKYPIQLPSGRVLRATRKTAGSRHYHLFFRRF